MTVIELNRIGPAREVGIPPVSENARPSRGLESATGSSRLVGASDGDSNSFLRRTNRNVELLSVGGKNLVPWLEIIESYVFSDFQLPCIALRP